MKAKKSNLTVLIALAVALVLMVSLTFALFTQTVDGRRAFTLSNFTSSVQVYFDGHTTAANPATASGTVGGANYYEVRLQDGAGVTNYIGDLRVQVKYQGKGVGLLRVRVAEEWSTTSDGVRYVKPYTIEVPYLIGANNANLYSGTGNKEKWFDYRTGDHCFYYATPLSKANETTIPLITGVDMTKLDTDASTVNIIIDAEAVQVNRYPQYWGITSLPWSGASSATEIDALTTSVLS